jgi:signal transduction histidine kinase/ligand-binding sensor domain-containing protein
MKRVKGHLYLIFLISFALQFSVKGQINHIKFEYLSTKDGLSGNRVKCFCRDSKGYLWIGYETGLDRYDSYRIKSYVNTNSPGTIGNNEVNAIFEDSRKNLWVGTSDGLSLYIPEKDSFITFKNSPHDTFSLDNNHVSEIFEDTNNNLWISTRGSCLNRWIPQKKAFARYQFNNNSDSAFVKEDSKGQLWIVSNSSEIICFNVKSGKHISYPIPVLGKGTKKLYIDNEDKVWILTNYDGIFIFDPVTKKTENINSLGNGKGTNGKIVTDIVEEDNRYLWIGIDQGGINRYDKITKTFQYIVKNDKQENGLSNNGIWQIYKDYQGIIWIATSGGGVNYYNPYKFKFKLYRHNPNNSNSLSSNTIGCFYEDTQGMIWIGTDDNGLDLFNPQTEKFKTFKSNPSRPFSISNNTIRCIAEDKDKDLWISTWSKGLNRYNRKTGKFYCYMPSNKDSASISDKTIWHFIIDHKGIFWLGTHTLGVDLFDKDKGVIKRFRHNPNNPNSLSSNVVWYVHEDKKNNIWLCTNNGLNRYDSIKQSFYVYNNLPSRNIKVITEDNNGYLWVGTDKGFCKIKADGTILEVYDESHGLIGNVVQGMVCDKKGVIWIATNKGLSSFNPSKKIFRNFTIEDGLQDYSFFQESFLKTRKGEIYFGGYGGFNSFHPDSFKADNHISPVLITEFQIFNKHVIPGNPKSPLKKQITLTKEITLTHVQSVFSFGFTAINFTNSEKIQYAYKLEGFEEDWNYTDAHRRFATYTNLNAGNYVFRVKATNNDGSWNKNEASIKIIILPPWWKTWWFKLLVIIFIISTSISYYYYKISLYKKQKQLLEQEVSLRTEELRNANEELTRQTEIVQQTNTQLEEHQQFIEEQAEELRVNNDELTEKKRRIEEQAEKLAENNKELSLLNATKDKFFSIIAHDLRNPFNAVIGFSDLLLSNFKRYENEKIERYLKFIYISSISGSELLTNLLFWSRSQTGSIQFNPVELNLSSLIDNSINLLIGSAQSKNISIEKYIDETITCYVDENMLKTVIRNLISNAIKFTPKKGNISILASISGNHILVSVTDTGVGMSKEVVEKLFTQDYSLSTRGTANESGTGLGLILCKEFVEKHGGEIWAESEEKKGSTFIFTIPLH